VKRTAVPTAVLVVSALIVALLAYGVLKQGQNTSIDQAVAKGDRPTAPGADIERPLLQGSGERKLADYRGKVVVLNFWASWCDPCRAEAPALERFSKTLGDKGVVLGATYDDVASDSMKFARENGLTYTSVKDVAKALADKYGTRSLPETFVIDPQGKIVAMRRGEIDAGFLKDAMAKAETDS
jgi:cytochrome c biogenesis protein CcmG, thiol:disulfide interchange protein DsbE